MTLRLYNTLTRQREEFTPRPGVDDIGMYVCGPTVYDYAHIGNARPFIIFDVLYRLLKQSFPRHNVTYVRNITDVDDKIIQAAEESGEAIEDITSRTTDAFHADMAAVGNLTPDVEPRATDHIPQMISLIQRLLDNGNAYFTNSHVLFETSAMADYGQLSRNKRDDILEGTRVEVAPYKKDAADFVLWKPSDDGQPGWDSPWGFGRPGWHLECSAMSSEYLGLTFDIHGGGQDLIFPHHENEIAQSRCAHPDEEFARFWLHNGYLMVEGEKMSKSLGNFITIRDLLAHHHGETIRLAMLKTHYRSPLDWTENGLREAKTELDRFYGALRGIENDLTEMSPAVSEALSDDLNSSQALAALHEIAGELNKAEPDDEKSACAARLRGGGGLLGLLQLDPEEWFRWQPEGLPEGLAVAEIEALIEDRKAARTAKDFETSDRIRDELAAAGVLLEDGASGTTWKRG